MTREQIQTLETEQLWAILRSRKALTEQFCNELTWVKEELRQRGFAV